VPSFVHLSPLSTEISHHAYGQRMGGRTTRKHNASPPTIVRGGIKIIAMPRRHTGRGSRFRLCLLVRGLDLVEGLTMCHRGFRNAVLPEKYEHLMHRSCYEWNGAGQSRPEKEITTNGEESQTEILRPHFMPHLTRERYHAGHYARPQETGRPTERMVWWPRGMDSKTI